MIQTIFPGALTAPLSPLVPRTPFVSGDNQRTPTTPFTPLTAAPHARVLAGYHLKLLDDHDNSLAHVFNQLLRFVERDLSLPLELSERVASKADAKPMLAQIPQAIVAQQATCFNIMSNVVWDEIGRGLIDELGSILFAAGRPEDFKKVEYVIMICQDLM